MPDGAGGGDEEPELEVPGDDEDGGGEDGDEDEADEVSSGRRRRGRGGGSGRAGLGGRERDDDKSTVEAEKKKVQVVFISFFVGAILLVAVMAIALGPDSRPSAEEATETEAVKGIVEVSGNAIEQMKALDEEGTSEFKAAQELEGDAKVGKLERAKSRLDEAIAIANAQRNKVPEGQRGASFDRLDSIEQDVGKVLYQVRKQILENRK